MAEAFTFKDPSRAQELKLEVVPADKLTVIVHQRKARPTHVERLTASIERIGFVVPLVVVEASEGKHPYAIIDGQHRFSAGKKAGLKEFPVIVVPPGMARRMMSLNVEKDLNIREKCGVALSLYREMMEAEANLSETDEDVIDAVEQAHYLTLGLAYEKAARLAGSSFEPILKRCDGFLDESLREAYGTREKRADSVLEAADLTKTIGEKIKEMGAWHQFVTQQILSYANPFKRKRGPVDFDEAFGKLIEALHKLEQNPEKALRAPIG